MLTKSEAERVRERTAEMFDRLGITLTPEERTNIEIAEFGLDDLEHQGLELITYVNNERYCAKELVLFPHQTCPQHRHPPIGSDPGKMETFRCRWGKVYLYVEGRPTPQIQAQVPEGSEAYYTVFHECALNPGEQFTIPPNTFHWFQAGDEGAIVSEFSSPSRDEFDIWADPNIKRIPEFADD
jgi:D-lyxose ketol-isomerase